MKIVPSEGSTTNFVRSFLIAAVEGAINRTVDGIWMATVQGPINKPVPFGILGDVNMDGAVTISDYTLIRYHYQGLQLLTGNPLQLGDVNRDGVCDETDYDLVQAYILG